MIGIRVIPCLLLKGSGLVKTIRFQDSTYLGDPRNVVRIFNEREVDELIIFDMQEDSTPTPTRKTDRLNYFLFRVLSGLWHVSLLVIINLPLVCLFHKIQAQFSI